MVVGASASISAGAGMLTGTLTNTDPSVLVQAVVERLGKTEDGDLIIVVRPTFETVARLLQQDPDALYKIDCRKLEELVAASYHAAGFEEVELTPRSGDLGRDVIATKRGL